ncbi:MAG: transcriptional regulator, LysR family [Chthoniobacteraceae bacterium]|nr:transcriptional regulator, LysR family [Chthoniobacteraceae bacterium]
MDMFNSLLSTRGLSLDRLTNFCRIAEAGGIAKAAEGDPGKQSLYSRQIRELEEFFGVELKRRHGKGMAITEAGWRLVRLTRAHLLGLADFQSEARSQPKRLSIVAGNSILEWVLLPKIGLLRNALPNTTLEFSSERTGFLVRKLIDMTIDVGLIRENALQAPLKARRLFELGYSVFVPDKLAAGVTKKDLKARLADIPLATSIGGHFREVLEQAAAKAKWPMEIQVACSSFTQAARTVKAGTCAAVLPDIAAQDFDLSNVMQFKLPFMSAERRKICVVWNPRLAGVRPIITAAVDAIRASVGQEI